MSQVEIIKAAVELAQSRDSFNLPQFEKKMLEKVGEYRKCMTFNLTRMKRAGYLENVSHGVWRGTDMIKGLKVDSYVMDRINRLGFKKRVRRGRLPKSVYVAEKTDQSIGKKDIVKLMLEIRGKNPTADISCLMDML